ncbi:MAG: tryptophan--tRNA ligase, partial [Rhodospirillales bacterium]|nr:tryptophan--tRNA ligase [Rhodospirillales bacterium]
YFPLPEPQILGEATRVMSLRDGTAKMSKSDPSDNSRINMTDDADLIVQKIRKARTDPEPLPDSVEGLEGRAEAANLIGIYAALSGDARSDILNTFGGKLFSEFKGALSDLALDKLGPIGAEMQRLMKDPAYVDGVLRTGAERAKEISEKHMSEIHELIGVLRV